jgi:hypothetical protein
MGEVSRRRFLTQTSVAVGSTLAAVAALPRTAVAPSTAAPTPNAPSVEPRTPAALAGMALPEPMVVHVRDVATAEIGVMVGTQEFVYHDPEIVTRVLQRAKQAAKREG